VQAFYDQFAKWFFVCGCAEMTCVTKRPKTKKFCDNAGHFVGGLVFTIALCCALFTLYMNSAEYRGDAVEINCAVIDNTTGVTVVPNKTATPPEMCALDMGAAMRTFGYARMVSFLGSTTGVLTVMFMIKRSINIPCIPFKKGLGEMVKLKADDAPSDAMRVRKKEKGGSLLTRGSSLLTKGSFGNKEGETEDDFKERRDENEWCFPTYDELGPHPPLEPSIFSNTLKCCESKVKVAPASAADVKEYYVDGEWVGWSKVKEAVKPGNTKAPQAPPKKSKKGAPAPAAE